MPTGVKEEQRVTVERVANDMRRKIEERIQSLSQEAMSDFQELCCMLQKSHEKDDQNEMNNVASAMMEIIYPESIKDDIVDECMDDEEREARGRLTGYRKKVGGKIKQIRESLRMTQEELAEKADIPQSHVSRLENGIHAPTFVTMDRIAKALNTTPGKIDPGFEE